MHVLLLAAGQSKRFKEEGFHLPKPLLEIEWRGLTLPMVEHVINTIPVQFDNISVALPPRYELHKHRFRSYEVNDSKGPAHTALKMMRVLGSDSYLILDSDVLNFTNDLYNLTKVDGCGVLVSRSANPAFSYVDKLGVFNHIQEKQRISEYAVRGAYYVPNEAGVEFIVNLGAVIANKQEPYISHAFDLMRTNKVALETTYIPIEWGTPRDIRISGAQIASKKGD